MSVTDNTLHLVAACIIDVVKSNPSFANEPVLFGCMQAPDSVYQTSSRTLRTVAFSNELSVLGSKRPAPGGDAISHQ